MLKRDLTRVSLPFVVTGVVTQVLTWQV